MDWRKIKQAEGYGQIDWLNPNMNGLLSNKYTMLNNYPVELLRGINFQYDPVYNTPYSRLMQQMGKSNIDLQGLNRAIQARELNRFINSDQQVPEKYNPSKLINTSSKSDAAHIAEMAQRMGLSVDQFKNFIGLTLQESNLKIPPDIGPLLAKLDVKKDEKPDKFKQELLDAYNEMEALKENQGDSEEKANLDLQNIDKEVDDRQVKINKQNVIDEKNNADIVFTPIRETQMKLKDFIKQILITNIPDPLANALYYLDTDLNRVVPQQDENGVSQPLNTEDQSLISYSDIVNAIIKMENLLKSKTTELMKAKMNGYDQIVRSAIIELIPKNPLISEQIYKQIVKNFYPLRSIEIMRIKGPKPRQGQEQKYYEIYEGAYDENKKIADEKEASLKEMINIKKGAIKNMKVLKKKSKNDANKVNNIDILIQKLTESIINNNNEIAALKNFNLQMMKKEEFEYNPEIIKKFEDMSPDEQYNSMARDEYNINSQLRISNENMPIVEAQPIQNIEEIKQTIKLNESYELMRELKLVTPSNIENITDSFKTLIDNINSMNMDALVKIEGPFIKGLTKKTFRDLNDIALFNKDYNHKFTIELYNILNSIDNNHERIEKYLTLSRKFTRNIKLPFVYGLNIDGEFTPYAQSYKNLINLIAKCIHYDYEYILNNLDIYTFRDKSKFKYVEEYLSTYQRGDVVFIELSLKKSDYLEEKEKKKDENYGFLQMIKENNSCNIFYYERINEQNKPEKVLYMYKISKDKLKITSLFNENQEIDIDKDFDKIYPFRTVTTYLIDKHVDTGEPYKKEMELIVPVRIL